MRKQPTPTTNIAKSACVAIRNRKLHKKRVEGEPRALPFQFHFHAACVFTVQVEG